MTCVWDGIINKLKLKTTPEALVMKLKHNNKLTEHVTVNNIELTDTIKKENYERIRAINIKSIKRGTGYDCSTCDPILILVSELYNVTIIHQFCGVRIVYYNKNAKRLVKFSSNTSHFW